MILPNLRGQLTQLQKGIWNDLARLGSDYQVADVLRKYYEELNSIKEWIMKQEELFSDSYT